MAGLGEWKKCELSLKLQSFDGVQNFVRFFKGPDFKRDI